ncbi:MAG: hypothetical protein K2G23_08840, partial [Muribaculaceae bacterium]|nr:hypothetical protein [Muribaculaceae bacterium]
MKKLLLILMALISCYAIQCNAIKIVDGWTWKYNAWGNGDYYYFFDFKFDGTEEINGITYHIFRNTSAEKRLRISASGYRDCEIGLSEPWYVREEEGRFYVLFPHAGDQWDEEVEWNRWITPEDREVMLYDFNATTGDEYICGRGLEITLKANVEEMVYLPDEGGELKCQKILYESSYNDPENAIHNRSFPEVIVSEDFG